MSATETAKRGEPNRLVHETSTYLLQHAYNPVDWYPWSSEALERAREEQRPILLSVGYAACHWCHVMEHESFEDADTAKMMNDHFVNIKVDREERTDIDEIYMKAVQLMTGHGGWPMTVFLTPDLKPFFAGTYFPPVDKHGMPSFKKILHGISSAWNERRDEVMESASDVTDHLKQLEIGVAADSGDAEKGDQFLNMDTLSGAIARLISRFDAKWGGFGGAPKFPHTFSLMLAMRYSIRTKEAKSSDRIECKELVQTTLERMAMGGIHDHLAGGFARYSVDRQWLIPHFEKMLYDNALLCSTYFEAFLLTGRQYFRDVAEGILKFTSSELRTENGAFYSSLDADSEGEEGKFYVWTPEQVKEVVGDKDGEWLNELYGVTTTGNFEHGTSALHYKKTPEEIAKDNNMSYEDLLAKLAPLKEKLLAKRAERIRPGRDEKVLTSWNSLMISAYVDGYRVTRKTEYLDEAKTAANFIFDNLMPDGNLLRTWGQGKAKLSGYLDDYSYFVQALLDLASVDADSRWFTTAVKLTDYMLAHFWDDENGGLYYTSDTHEELIVRPKNHFDGSVPSGASVALMNLLRLEKLTGEESYRQSARTILRLYGEYLVKGPSEFANSLCALDFYLHAIKEIVVVSQPGQNVGDVLFPIFAEFDPDKVVLVTDTESMKGLTSPLIEGRTAEGGKPTVYVCENFTCKQPIVEAEQIPAALKRSD
jgi:uncharacterized protein YyaL (SSP411 family)